MTSSEKGVPLWLYSIVKEYKVSSCITRMIYQTHMLPTRACTQPDTPMNIALYVRIRIHLSLGRGDTPLSCQMVRWFVIINTMIPKVGVKLHSSFGSRFIHQKRIVSASSTIIDPVPVVTSPYNYGRSCALTRRAAKCRFSPGSGISAC